MYRPRSNSENPALLQAGMQLSGVAAASMEIGLEKIQGQYERLRADLVSLLQKKIIEAFPDWTREIKTWLADNSNADAGQIIQQLQSLQMSSASAGSGWSGDSTAKALSVEIARYLKDYTPIRFLRALEADRAKEKQEAEKRAQAQQAVQALLVAQQDRLAPIPELENPAAQAAPPAKTPDEMKDEISTLKIKLATLEARLDGKTQEVVLLNRELDQWKGMANKTTDNFRSEVSAFRTTIGEMNRTMATTMGEMNRTMTATMGDMNTTMSRLNQKVGALETTLVNQTLNVSSLKDEPEQKKSVPVVNTKRVVLGKQFLAKDQLLTGERIGAICALGDLLHTFNALPMSEEDKAVYAFGIECIKLLASESKFDDCFKKLTLEGSAFAKLLTKTPAEFREFFNQFSQIKDNVPLILSNEKQADLKNCLKGMFSEDGYNVPELKKHFPSKANGNGKKVVTSQTEGAEKKNTQGAPLLSEVFKVPASISRTPAATTAQPTQANVDAPADPPAAGTNLDL